MIGLLLAVFIFNFLAFTRTKRFTKNQTIHIWFFTIAFQTIFDIFVEFKLHGYWYFSKDPDWQGLIAHTVLLPPVNMLFLNWYPFKGKFLKKFIYVGLWTVGILMYEMITLLPEPWGYFYYGWWTIWHAAVIDPILFLILLVFYNWIVKVEKEVQTK
ncbi:hypothetical protein [Fredinandcohnia sp. 179-A 10B2 NHS]|uniref:hypothetical protein n=1 Tax=Fredinandcohnia sp. 179-A 10B2 NHS TaxID=3235176 RepID=UPI0039A1779D